jgi:hypothetical protein
MDVYQRRRLVALSVLAGVFILFVLLIRSCGGDDSETPVSPVAGGTGEGGAAALSLDDYISQADTICLEANTAQAAVEEDLSDLERASRQRARIIGNAYESIQSLPVPEDADTRQLERYLGALQEQVAGYEDQALAVQRGEDITEIDAALEQSEVDAREAGNRFGFEVCGDLDETSSGGGGGGGGGADTATEETDTGAAVAPESTEPVVPEATETVAPEATTPPTDTGTATPDTDTGTATPDTGGTAPDDTGGVTP